MIQLSNMDVIMIRDREKDISDLKNSKAQIFQFSF